MKLWGGRFREAENRLMEDFNSSFPFDKRLWEEDISGSMAHVSMLGRQGIISEEEALLGIGWLLKEGKVKDDAEKIALA